MSKTFNVEFTPRDFQGLSAGEVERAWRDSGLPGDVGFNESEIFFQREWGYGRETDRLVTDHNLAGELRSWGVEAMAVAIALVEHEEHNGTGSASPRAISLTPSVSGRASSGRSLPSESQLEDLIIKQWESFDFGADLEYVGRQIPCGNIGVLDILARDRDTRAYVVMELKKGEADDEVFGQLARYMGWVIKNMAEPEGVGVEGIIIASHLSSKLQSAAASHSGVGLLCYDATEPEGPPINCNNGGRSLATDTPRIFSDLSNRLVCACGSSNLAMARFCRRCGKRLTRESYVLLAALVSIFVILVILAAIQ